MRNNAPNPTAGQGGGDPPGRLFVFEGPDGVGKTTLAGLLSEHFSKMGLRNELLSFPGREPGTVSELIYRLYHDPAAFGLTSILPLTMQTIVTAAHIDVIETRIKPLLHRGIHVILDRFWWSTWVYATMLHVPTNMRDLMINLEMESWSDITPELVVLVLRPQPLSDVVERETRARLTTLYRDLALKQSSSLAVELVINDRAVSDALENIIPRIRALLKL